MGGALRSLQLCLLALLCGSGAVQAKNTRWERVLQGGANALLAQAPAAALQQPPQVCALHMRGYPLLVNCRSRLITVHRTPALTAVASARLD